MDDYVVYNNILPVGRHHVDKDENIQLERTTAISGTGRYRAVTAPS
jgi:hypothetical protein